MAQSEIRWFNLDERVWDSDQQNKFIRLLEDSNIYRGAEAKWATIVLSRLITVNRNALF